jgi:hypothetical protein
VNIQKVHTIYILNGAKKMNNIKTNYKLFPDFQIALFDFMGTISNVYEETDLKLSDREKIKIALIRERNAKQ